MRLWIVDTEGKIKEIDAKEVTNPIYFNLGNSPTEDGLFSHTIFGTPGSNERKDNWGYINLNKIFIHPQAFKLLVSLNRKFEDLLLSRKFFKIDDKGELVEDSENGDTGILFFYKNYKRINIKDTGTSSRSKKKQLLELFKPNELFITKFLVCPAYYRDYNKGNSTTGQKVDEVNKLYNKLIMLTRNNSMNDDGYSFSGLTTESNTQIVLNQLYEFWLGKMSGKTGHIHQAMLSKTVDDSTRSVVSTPKFANNKLDDLDVPFGYAGVPLTQLVVLFKNFFIKWIQDFMAQHEFDIKVTEIKDKQNIQTKLNLRELFDSELIIRLLEIFIESEESRFQTLSVRDKKGNLYQLEIMTEELGRDFTLIDLLYLAAEDICKDKHVYITRYPIESFGNIVPNKIKILTTRQVESKTIGDKYFPRYPVVYPDYPAKDNILIMTLQVNEAYLDSFGMDFDGDTASIRGVYSIEANLEAEEIMKKVHYILKQDGTPSRGLKNEAVQALYALTKD